jgi:hypothetical protein
MDRNYDREDPERRDSGNLIKNPGINRKNAFPKKKNVQLK